MDVLIRLRPISLAVLVFGVAGMGYAFVLRNEPAYLLGLSGCFSGIMSFVTTEAFGRLSRTRPVAIRWAARAALLACVIALVLYAGVE